MKPKDIREKLKTSLIPSALQALEDRLGGENVSPSDIRLAFDLAKSFGALEELPEVESKGVVNPLLAFKKPEKSLVAK